jgi:hypothetical protein
VCVRWWKKTENWPSDASAGFSPVGRPNGAGKSTLFRALVRDGIIGADLTFVNADLYERDHLQHIADSEQRSSPARHWADAQRAAKPSAKESFA